MAQVPVERPIQWDTERYVIDREPTCADDLLAGTASEEAKVAHLFGVPALAQELFDNGLIFLINQNVLHQHGYALGVTGRVVQVENATDGFAVDGLCLCRSDDPDGIWFDEATVVAGRRKLRGAAK